MTEPIIVSYSEIETGRQCPLKHQLAYVERWAGKSKVDARSRGTLWHQALEIHYTELQRGSDYGDACSAVYSFLTHLEIETVRMNQEDRVEMIRLVRWMYSGYVETYAYDPRKWEILEIESRRIIPLSSRFHLKVRIDLVMRDRRSGHIWLWDHKSEDRLSTSAELDLLDQFPLYRVAYQHDGTNIFGCLYNCARSRRNKVTPQPLPERFVRIPINHIQPELDTMLEEFLATCERLYSPANRAERHPDKDRCRYRCDYTQPCLTGRKYGPGRLRLHLQDSGFKQDFTRH